MRNYSSKRCNKKNIVRFRTPSRFIIKKSRKFISSKVKKQGIKKSVHSNYSKFKGNLREKKNVKS